MNKWEQHREWSAADEEQAAAAAAARGVHNGNGEQQQRARKNNNSNNDNNADEEESYYNDSYDDLIAAHRVLGTRPGDALSRIKLSYMMRCRESHPEIDGNPATFYKIALAYERVMKDRGIEMRDGRITFSESVPKLPPGHDILTDVSRDVLIKAAEEIPGVDRYERSAALEQLRENRMSQAGTSEMLRIPGAPPVSEMKALEHLELEEDILLAPQALRGMPWHEQPFRMLSAEVRQREGDSAAKLLESIVAPVRLKIGGVESAPPKQLPEGSPGNNGQQQIAGQIEASSSPSCSSSLAVDGSRARGSLTGDTTSAVVPTSATSLLPATITSIPGVPDKVVLMMDAAEKQELLDRAKYESRCLAPVTDELTPEVMHKADELGTLANNEKGVLKFQQPEVTARVTEYLGPGTQVIAARQFEALGRAGKMSTYARYSNFPHPPKPLSELPSDLTEDHQLRPEEEEAVARGIIHKQLDEGKISPETVMNYLSKSTTVAGMAAQTATVWMESTEERRFLFVEFSMFLALALALTMCGLATLAAWIRYHHVFNNEANKKKGAQQYLNLDTMLPWWGNDALYEQSVKRIFLEEFKKARQAAEQMRHYQAGLEQETMTAEQKKHRELTVFAVSPDDVVRMRQKVKMDKMGGTVTNPVEPEEQAEQAVAQEMAQDVIVSAPAAPADTLASPLAAEIAAAAAATEASTTSTHIVQEVAKE